MMRSPVGKIIGEERGTLPYFPVSLTNALVVWGEGGCGSLEMDNAAADCDGDGLSAVAGAQLFHNVLDVDFDGFFGDEELAADVAVAIAFGDLSENFNLTRGQGFIAHMLGKLGGQLRGDALFPGMDLADSFDEVFGRHAFHHLPPAPAFQITLH